MSDAAGPYGDVAGALLAELEADGELVDAGGFTIDAAQAQRKLQTFQVADPHSFVLLMIEAAVMAGVRPVALCSDEGLSVELGDLRITRGELEQWFAAAFPRLDGVDEPERTRRRILQKLAIATSTALRLDGCEVEVEVAAPEQRLRLRHEGGDEHGTVEVLAVDTNHPSGARIRVRPRLGVGGAALDLIRERCRFSALEILVDGERVSFGHAQALQVDVGFDELRFGSNARKRRVVRVDGRAIGLAGFRLASDAPAELLILTNGVFSERIELDGEGWAPGFVAVVELDLAKDLGQARILRGPELDRVRAAVRELHDRVAGGRATPEPLPPEPGRGPIRIARGWGYAQLLLALVVWWTLPTGPNFLAFFLVFGGVAVLVFDAQAR